MISLDPSSRLTCEEYLTTYRDVAFPEIFYTFLHPFIASLNETSNSSTSAPSTSYTARESNAPTTTSGMNLDPMNNGLNAGVELRSAADDKIERIWSEWEMIEKYLDDEGSSSTSVKLGEDRRPEAAESSRAGRGDVSFFLLVYLILIEYLS